MAAAMKAGEKTKQAICILNPRSEYCITSDTSRRLLG